MTTTLQELDEVLASIADDNDLASSLNAERFLDDHAPEIRAALELHAQLNDGWVLVPNYRGYAHLGIGGYFLYHSHANDPAELCIVPASAEEIAGRAVGDLRDDGPDEIQAERMAVRLQFANVEGLDALEQQLRLLREVHFNAAQQKEHGDEVTSKLTGVGPLDTPVAGNYVGPPSPPNDAAPPAGGQDGP